MNLRFAAMLGASALLGIAPVEAQTAAPDLATAQERVLARLTAGDIAKGPPRLSVPADAVLLRAAFDTAAIHALTLDDLPTLFTRCTGPLTWGGKYILWGGDMMSDDPDALVAQLNSPAAKASTALYQDELTLTSSASFMCLKRLSLSFKQLVMAMPEANRKQIGAHGLDQMRAGAITLIQGLFGIEVDASFRPANKALIAAVLMSEPDDSLLMLKPNQRAQLRTALDGVLQTPGVTNSAQLEAFGRVIDRAPCTDLCLIP